ncbi:metallophosphatase family protein [Oscillochloris sp. ZM17-4]|uniref:metallophosphoesterase family protein n=1 Tax=Oscillochloris sp. ZM17-4 TaxID=2866714 RepID=UPI001C73807F|nr:metallophosphoesterase family protein [Oscillochloris sp. ZM17-4]MBX0331074.1 metallophosphatase family protein [Oscillochloris sp. ZM17-4]
MTETSLALIADIHGNAWALDAVLADIDRRGVRQIINLGDCAYGSLDPAGTLERLMDRAIPTVSGNQDRIVHAPPPAVVGSADQDFITARLGPDQVAWLRDLPQTLVVGDLFCCHGTPALDTTCLLEDVTPQSVRLRGDADLAALLAGVTQPVIACGHSHQPRVVALADGRLVVNPGSVGVPAYTDDQPHPHAMEAGSPHARYAILREAGGGWSVKLVAVPYDWDVAADEARRNGRPDRAAWIATGRAG